MKIINCKSTSFSMGNINDRTRKMICSRHVLVFGEDVQERISDLTIGVVSTGGLGTGIIEQLMRLFPGKLIYIDNDVVELSNLNRLVGATIIDSRLNTRKVDLASRNILAFNPHQEIIPINGDFLEKENQEQFRQCDFIFGASDSDAVRIATNRLCLAHGIAYLDCGVGAVVKDGQLQAAGGQVIRILPDSGFCLHCSGLFNVEHAMDEFLSDDERKRQEKQGYIRGTHIAAPQVYALNMMVAAWAVWAFTRMVSGEKLSFDGIAIDAKGLKTYTWKESAQEIHDCPTCGRNGIVFAGDDVDLLCRDESEVDRGEIETENPTNNDDSERVSVQSDRDMPFPLHQGIIIGETMDNPFCLRLFSLM